MQEEDIIKVIDIDSEIVDKLSNSYTSNSIKMFELSYQYHQNRIKFFKEYETDGISVKYPTLDQILEDTNKLYSKLVWSHNDVMSMLAMNYDEEDSEIYTNEENKNSFH